ncbi:hypothetical protein LTR86_010154 [Recurvomyces mirabilis]|nr:hypothetical protein LTR86_010154 [Recurvomyces mirabilis]
MAPAATSPQQNQKIAIVGSGCAGLGAAWALKDTDYEVHIFEKSSRLGGHTNTQIWTSGDREVPVDTGFIVMNTATYPNFIRFLQEVGVDPVETEMTFGVSRDHGQFEWSGEARGIFAQRRNLFRLRHWRMIFDIVRFNQFALDLIADEEEGGLRRLGSPVKGRRHDAEMTIGAYLEKEGYSRAFRDDYLIPMTAAVWSTSPDKASLEFPAATLRYIDAIVKSFPAGRLHLHTSCEVANVLRPWSKDDTDVTVSWLDARSGRIEGDVFAHVILACHGDEILPLLSRQSPQPTASLPHKFNTTTTTTTTTSDHTRSSNFIKSSSGIQYISQEELDVLSAFQTSENTAYLHSDLTYMPTRRACWTAWNYLITSPHPSQLSSPAGVSLTYSMNILQHIPEEKFGPVLVTMNPEYPPDPEKTQGVFVYRHPLYTVESVKAQKRLEGIQNSRGVSYCGAWTKYGFHEDGFSSGLRVAREHLGAELGFEFVDSTFSRGHKPVLGWRDYVLRVILLVLMVCLRVFEVVVGLPVVRRLVRVAEGVGEVVLDLGEYAGLLT